MPLSPRPVARHPRVDFAAPAREPTFLPTPAGLPPVDNPHLPATLPYLDPDSPLANVVPHAPTGREVLWKQSVIWKVRKAMLQRQKESLAKRGERVALRAEDLEFRFNRLHDQFQNLRIAREEEEARSRESTASGVDATDGLEKEKDADNDKPGTRPSPPSTANSLAGFYARKMKKLDSQLGEIRAQLQQAFRARAQNLEPVPEEVKELEKPETPERANFICSPQKLIMARFRRTAGLRTRTPTPAEDGRKRLKKIEALADAANAQAAAQERRRHTETVVSELQRMYLKVGSLYRTLQVLGRAQSEEAEERFLQLYSEILCGEPEREPAGQLEVTLEAASPGPSPAAGRGGGRRRSKTLPPTGRAVSLTSPGKVKPIASPLSAGPRANRNAESSSAGPEGGTPPTAPLPTISIQAALTDAFVQAVESDALHYGPAYDTLVQMMLTLLMETFALYQNLARQSLQPPPLTLPTPQRRSPRPLPTRGSPDPELKVPASAATLAKPSGIFRLEEERLLPPDYKGFPPSPPRSTSPSPGRGHSPHSAAGSSPRDLPHVTAQLRRASQRLHSEAEIVLFDGAPRRRRSVAVPRPEDGADWPSVSQAITPRLLEVEMDGAMFSTRSKTADDTDAETGSAFMTYLPSIWDRAEEAVRRRSKMQELEANVARTNDVFYLEKHLNDFFSPARAVPAAVPTLVARALGPSVSSSAPRTPATLPQLVPRGRGTAEQSARSGGPEGPRVSQRSRSAVVMSSREDRAEETLELGGILLEYRRDQKSSASHSHRSGESTQSGGLTGRSMGGTSSVRKLPQSPGSRATSRQLLAASTARAQVLSRQRSSPADMAISGTLPPLGRP